jgi:hypothetical protein
MLEAATDSPKPVKRTSFSGYDTTSAGTTKRTSFSHADVHHLPVKRNSITRETQSSLARKNSMTEPESSLGKKAQSFSGVKRNSISRVDSGIGPRTSSPGLQRANSGLTRRSSSFVGVPEPILRSTDNLKRAKALHPGTIICYSDEQANQIVSADGKQDGMCFGKRVLVLEDPENPAQDNVMPKRAVYTGDSNKDMKPSVIATSFSMANAMSAADGYGDGKFFGAKIIIKQ